MSYHQGSVAALQCSPRAATLLKFLMEKANNLTHSSFWRIAKIAAGCGFSRSTYHRAIRELTGAGLVTVIERSDLSGRQTSNEYILNTERLASEPAQPQTPLAPQIKVSRHVRLTGIAYKIYLYLQAKCGRKGYCVSNHDIAAACGTSLNTVRRYIRRLQNAGYIERRRMHRKDNGQGYNFYAIKTPTKVKLLHIMAFIIVYIPFFHHNKRNPSVFVQKRNTSYLFNSIHLSASQCPRQAHIQRTSFQTAAAISPGKVQHYTSHSLMHAFAKPKSPVSQRKVTHTPHSPVTHHELYPNLNLITVRIKKLRDTR